MHMPLSKSSPAGFYFRSLLIYNLLSAVLVAVVSIINYRQIGITALYWVNSLFNALVIFLPFLFWYNKSMPRKAWVVFLPVAISAFIVLNYMYRLQSGKTTEMAFGVYHTFKLWQWRCCEPALVVLTCWVVYRRYFRSEGNPVV
jgi:hypothetical protein